jgi:hypothetical protein
VPDHAEPAELTRVLGDPLAEKASSRKRAARDDLVRQLSAEGWLVPHLLAHGH